MTEKELKQNTDRIIDEITTLSDEEIDLVNGGEQRDICPMQQTTLTNHDSVTSGRDTTSATYNCKNMVRGRAI